MSTQFSNPLTIANASTNGLIKPDGVTAIMDSNGLITKVIDISPIAFVGTVLVGDAGSGSSGSIPVTDGLASATKSNPNTDTSIVTVVFSNAMPDTNYLIYLSGSGSNSHTTALSVGTRSTTGFVFNIRQISAVVQAMTVNVVIQSYIP